jgi:hypothetical protein
MSALEIDIEGIGFWAPGWPDWERARAGLRGEAEADPQAPVKPSPTLLTAAERRRAPQPVALACEIATQACAASGREPSTLPSVFASVLGDLLITDYMCTTLASAPRELSPIRFHNSVHNAPAGYWTIAAQCHAPSTSISSWHASFAATLFEAAVEAIADDTAVLLVVYDTETTGPLVKVAPCSFQFGTALVVSPRANGKCSLRLRMNAASDDPGSQIEMPAAFASLAAGNPMAAGSLPLLAALAAGKPTRLQLPAGAGSLLQVDVDA